MTFRSILLFAVCVGSSVHATTFDLDNVSTNGVDFTEGFDAGDAFWADAAFMQLDYLASGGNPGGYVSYTVDPPVDESTIFRGHDAFNSSGDAFTGDWIAQGTTTLSFDVRHDFSGPVNFFARIATAQNFPAHIGVGFVPVQPGQWQTVTLDISEGAPGLINEGAPAFSYADTFSSVGNVQIGVSGVPEPSGAILALLGLAFMLRRIRS